VTLTADFARTRIDCFSSVQCACCERGFTGERRADVTAAVEWRSPSRVHCRCRPRRRRRRPSRPVFPPPTRLFPRPRRSSSGFAASHTKQRRREHVCCCRPRISRRHTGGSQAVSDSITSRGGRRSAVPAGGATGWVGCRTFTHSGGCKFRS